MVGTLAVVFESRVGDCTSVILRLKSATITKYRERHHERRRKRRSLSPLTLTVWGLCIYVLRPFCNAFWGKHFRTFITRDGPRPALSNDAKIMYQRYVKLVPGEASASYDGQL